jgi:NADH:ubiquinone oxidoreductase subunit 3 (subunit A)
MERPAIWLAFLLSTAESEYSMHPLLIIYLAMVAMFLPAMHITRYRHAEKQMKKRVITIQEGDTVEPKDTKVRLKKLHWLMVALSSIILPMVMMLLYLIALVVAGIGAARVGIILILLAIAVVFSPFWLGNFLLNLDSIEKKIKEMADG